MLYLCKFHVQIIFIALKIGNVLASLLQLISEMKGYWFFKMNLKILFLIFSLSTYVNANQRARDELEKDKSSGREEKLFSLFSVVTFKNSGCQSSSGTTGSGINRNGKFLSLLELTILIWFCINSFLGTCYTSTECLNKGGTASGGCAAG